VNVASVPQRSPFRYPGGKTWLIPTVRKWLRYDASAKGLIESFTGGGIVSLTAAFENMALSGLTTYAVEVFARKEGINLVRPIYGRQKVANVKPVIRRLKSNVNSYTIFQYLKNDRAFYNKVFFVKWMWLNQRFFPCPKSH